MENHAVQHNDRQRRRKGQIAEGQVRVLDLDGHGDKIQAAGAGVLHIDQRIADAADHAAADGRQQAVPLIDGQVRQDGIGVDGKHNHTEQAAQKERTTEFFIAEQHNGDVQHNGGNTDGQPEQAVQNGADARDTGDRHARRHGKAVNAQRGNEAADGFQQKVDPLVFCHRCVPLFLQIEADLKKAGGIG